MRDSGIDFIVHSQITIKNRAVKKIVIIAKNYINTKSKL